MSMSLVAKNRVKAIGSIPFRVLIVPMFLVFYAIYRGVVGSVRLLAQSVGKRLYLAPIVPIVIVPTAIAMTIYTYGIKFKEKVIEPISSSIFLCRSITGRAKFIMNRINKMILLEGELRENLRQNFFQNFFVYDYPNKEEIANKLEKFASGIEIYALRCDKFASEYLKAKEITLEMVSEFWGDCTSMKSFMEDYEDLFSYNFEELSDELSDELSEYRDLFKKFGRDIDLLQNNVICELEKIVEASNKSSQISNESDVHQADNTFSKRIYPTLAVSSVSNASLGINRSEPGIREV